jgi:tRNA nucleotidyltransferase/poly(A) polymerase
LKTEGGKMLKWLLNRNKNLNLPSGYRNKLDSDALKIIKTLQKAGYETYLVGGCVRDLLTGHTPKDFDIATSATPQKIKNLISRSFIIGRRFKIVVAKRNPSPFEQNSSEFFPSLLKAGKTNEKEIQITTFRRAPEMLNDKINENVFGSAKDDSFRRDFTVNGLFLDPFSDKIVDYVGGLEDIQKNQLRIIGHPEERFEEDTIRILRALRFCMRNGLELESKTLHALKKKTPLLAEAKKERVREEILKFLKEGTAEKAFEMLYDLGIWKCVSPIWHEFLEKNPENRRCFYKSVGALDKNDWETSFGVAPLLYLFLYPLTQVQGAEAKKNDAILKAVSEDLKISKIEKEEIQFIHTALKNLRSNSGSVKLAHKESQILRQIQLSLVLKTLAELDPKTWKEAWKAHQEPWKNHCRWILSTVKKQGEAPRPTGRRPFKKKRRRGPHKTAQAQGKSSSH